MATLITPRAAGALTLGGLLALACGPSERMALTVSVAPSLEDRNPDGTHFTPGTQTLLRGHHWLEGVKDIDLRVGEDLRGSITLRSDDPSHFFRVERLQMDLLVPRLHYAPADPPDAFDRFNLMMAEYSRNGLNVPTGSPGDSLAHFESDLREEPPWTLKGDYEFVPNPHFRPLRFHVVNNCLSPGLWEFSATDRTGELYHSWFTFPEAEYTELLSTVNGLPADFAKEAVQWRTDPAPLELGRLRKALGEAEPTGAQLWSGDGIGFSSQDSRRKLTRGYVQLVEEGGLRKPTHVGEMTQLPVSMTEFVPPGKYSISSRRVFDLRFLAQIQGARVTRVEPLTHYDLARRGEPHPGEYIELTLDLGDRELVVGNLPVSQLVPQEDFVLHGFGVGILDPSEHAERREILIQSGPAPSYAYVIEPAGDAVMALNSHELGVEQIFIRTHFEGGVPWWEVIVTSYERIADLAKYRVEVPTWLHAPLRDAAADYISPLYLTYRDDNIN